MQHGAVHPADFVPAGCQNMLLCEMHELDKRLKIFNQREMQVIWWPGCLIQTVSK